MNHRAHCIPVLLLGLATPILADPSVAPREPAGFAEVQTLLDGASPLLSALETFGGQAATEPVQQWVDQLQQAVNEAEVSAASATVRYASFAAWVVHRESKKVPASRRLIQITKSTGRSEEVDRYEKRHTLLEANINAAMQQYLAAIDSMRLFTQVAIHQALEKTKQELIEQGMVENIQVQQVVAAQVREFLAEDSTKSDEWLQQLKTLQQE